MSEQPEGMTELDEGQCAELLATASLGRLALNVHDVLDIFPVNFAMDEGRILFRTSEGTKLAELTIHPDVVFEVDEVGDEEAWSVVVRGSARTIEREDDAIRAERVAAPSTLPSIKTRIVEIVPRSMSGRRIRRGVEPSADWY